MYSILEPPTIKPPTIKPLRTVKFDLKNNESQDYTQPKKGKKRQQPEYQQPHQRAKLHKPLQEYQQPHQRPHKLHKPLQEYKHNQFRQEHKHKRIDPPQQEQKYFVPQYVDNEATEDTDNVQWPGDGENPINIEDINSSSDEYDGTNSDE